MIKAVFLDVDGVLTDGKVSVNASGEETKTISFDDIDAVFELKRSGIKIGFLTAEDNHFTEYVKRRFSPDFFAAGCKNKFNAFEGLIKGIYNPSEVCYIGDSKKDTALLEYLYHSFAPSDATAEAKSAAKTVLKAKRGEGAIKELLERILSLNEEGEEDFWSKKILEHIDVIKAIRGDMEILKRIKEAGDILLECFKAGGKLLICGNGGSAADAQHIATEFVSRFLLERPGMPAEALTANTSSLTAIGNDYGFDWVFARQVEAEGKKGDVLVGISTSGNSLNVIEAMKKARVMGIKTIGFAGRNKNTKIADVSDCLISVPSELTPRIQEGHILIGHMLCEYAEKKLFGDREHAS